VVGRFRGDLELLSASRALEQAFAGSPVLRRPLPDLAALKPPVPALDSIVTHPPQVPHTAESVAQGATQSVV